MTSPQEIFTSLEGYTIPTILIEDNTLAHVHGKGTINLDHEHIQNVLHVPSLYINFLSVYNITHLDTNK